MNKSKGFTVIELIVVVVIIAVLAVIVVTNVVSYNDKGKNAAIKADLGNELTEATKYFENSGNYDFWCSSTNTSFTKFKTAAENKGATSVNCYCDTLSPSCSPSFGVNTKWCTSVILVGSGAGTYCVDSSGAKLSGKTCSLGSGVCQ